jgi:hypothetical protein
MGLSQKTIDRFSSLILWASRSEFFCFDLNGYGVDREKIQMEGEDADDYVPPLEVYLVKLAGRDLYRRFNASLGMLVSLVVCIAFSCFALPLGL